MKTISKRLQRILVSQQRLRLLKIIAELKKEHDREVSELEEMNASLFGRICKLEKGEAEGGEIKNPIGWVEYDEPELLIPTEKIKERIVTDDLETCRIIFIGFLLVVAFIMGVLVGIMIWG